MLFFFFRWGAGYQTQGLPWVAYTLAMSLIKLIFSFGKDILYNHLRCISSMMSLINDFNLNL